MRQHESQRHGPHSAAWLAGFASTLALAMAVGAFGVFALGALAPLMTVELGMSRTQLGVLSATFFAVGAIAAPVAGPLVDVFGGRRLLVVLFVVGGAAVTGMAVAPSYGWLLLAAAGGGIALAVADPVTTQLVSVHICRGRQGTLLGLKQSGVQLAALVAGALLPAGALLLGWRGVLLASAALPVAGLLATLRLIPTAGPRPGARALTGVGKVGVGRVGSTIWLLSGYGFLMGTGAAAVGAYLPLYAFEDLGLSVTRSGLAAAVVGLTGMVARIVWGHNAERVRSLPLLLAGLAAGALVSQTLVWGAAAGGPVLLWVGAAGLGATATGWNAVGMLVVLQEVDVTVAGRVSGRVMLAFFAGFVVSPVLFGLSADATGSYAAGWAGAAAAFGGAALVAVQWHARVTRPPAP